MYIFILGFTDGHLFDATYKNPIAIARKVNCSQRESAKRLPETYSRVVGH